MLSIDATGTGPDQRSTFSDLIAGPAQGSVPQFSLAYAKSLGMNTLWLLPIHLTSIEGRQVDPNTHQLYNVGSPYSVKNFFEVMPLMAKSFKAGPTPASNDTPMGRQNALAEFVRFAKAADDMGIDYMMDVPFNHSGHDVELADSGQGIWGNPGSKATSEIRNLEARFFSLA